MPSKEEEKGRKEYMLRRKSSFKGKRKGKIEEKAAHRATTAST